MFVTAWYLYLVAGGGIDVSWPILAVTAFLDIVFALTIVTALDKFWSETAPGPEDL